MTITKKVNLISEIKRHDMEDTKKKLAIVIPAYKSTFFKETLESIANQSCKAFTLYIGDDASPHDLKSIVKTFKNDLQIIYKRFDENLGGIDLVAHWSRCISLTQDEEWLWLFSDDDVLDSDCVKLFYDNLSKYPDEDIFHFNVQIIDKNNNAAGKIRTFPDILSSEDFYLKRLTKELYSFVVEYVFRKDTFTGKGGFEPFDLGWSSDDATWIKLSADKGIKTINGSIVKWRASGINISSILNDKPIIIRKLNAHIKFLLWADKFFKENHIVHKATGMIKIKWLLTMLTETSSLSLNEKKNYILDSLKQLGLSKLKFEALSLHMYGEVKKKIKKRLPKA